MGKKEEIGGRRIKERGKRGRWGEREEEGECEEL